MRMIVSTLIAAIALMVPAHAATLTPPDVGYSATRTVNAAGTEISGKLYSENGNERWEMTMQGMRQISILRPDQQKIFMYMPDMNMAMEMGREEAKTYGIEQIPESVEAEAIGEETIDGEQTTKYRVIPTEKMGDVDVTVWLTEDGIPVKAAGESPRGPFTMQLTNLERGTQDAALFELPAGVTPMKMPAGMPAAMGGFPRMAP
ncbi:MAG: DUF4412 domain-containing protein [Parvibaculum sp.]